MYTPGRIFGKLVYKTGGRHCNATLLKKTRSFAPAIRYFEFSEYTPTGLIFGWAYIRKTPVVMGYSEQLQEVFIEVGVSCSPFSIVKWYL